MAEILGHNAGLGDRIVRVKSCQRAEVAFSRIDPVGRYEDEPMRRPALAVAAIGELSHSSGEPFWRAGGAEHRGQELVLDGALTWPLLRLSLGEVPMGTGSGRVEPLLRHRRPILGVEINPPARYPSSQLVGGIG